MNRAVKESLFLPHLARFRFPCPRTASDKRQIDPIRRDIRADFQRIGAFPSKCAEVRVLRLSQPVRLQRVTYEARSKTARTARFRRYDSVSVCAQFRMEASIQPPVSEGYFWCLNSMPKRAVSAS